MLLLLLMLIMLLLVLRECDITASAPNAAYASAANVRSRDLDAAMLIMLLMLLLLLLLVLLIRRRSSSAYYAIAANATIANVIAANATAANAMQDILLLMLISSGVLIIRYDDAYNVATANARSRDATNATTVNKTPM